MAEINLLVEVGNVSFWNIFSERNDGAYVIWNLVSFLFQGMLFLWKMMEDKTLDDLVVEEEVMIGVADQEQGNGVGVRNLDNEESIEEFSGDVTRGGKYTVNNQQSNFLLGRSHGQRQESVLLRDYVLHTLQKLSPSASSHVHKHSSGSPYPITHYVNYDTFSMQYCAFLAAITTGVEPNSFVEAMKNDRWKDTMKREIHSLEENKGWTIEPFPS